MDGMLYIIIFRMRDARTKDGQMWRSGNVFSGPDAERLAHNMAECQNAQSNTWEYLVVHGSIVTQETLTEADQRLGKF